MMFKLIIFTELLMTSLLISWFQENNDTLKRNDERPVTMQVVKSMPVFEGDLHDFISKNLIYPDSAIIDNIEGTVVLNFWVEVNCETTGHKVIKGVRSDLDAEALRVSKLIHFTKPAIASNKPIKVRYTISVRFKLPENKRT